MKHTMSLRHGPFEKLRTGKKTIEMRLWDEKRQLLQIGDELEFTDLSDDRSRIRARVKALHRFASFRDLYAVLDLRACGYAPGEAADPRDMEAYYPPQRQDQYGVVGIELENICAEEGAVSRTR